MDRIGQSEWSIDTSREATEEESWTCPACGTTVHETKRPMHLAQCSGRPE